MSNRKFKIIATILIIANIFMYGKLFFDLGRMYERNSYEPPRTWFQETIIYEIPITFG